MANPIIKELSGDIQNLAGTYKTVVASKEPILKAHAASKNGTVFTADTDKKWSFATFKEESAKIVVDKTKFTKEETAYFANYEKVAQTYIDRMTGVYTNNNKATPGKHKLPIKITGKMLADAAMKTFVKYNDINKVTPVEMVLAQLQEETHFGTVTPRAGSANSPFNVGVYDKGDASFLKEVTSPQMGIEMYFDLMAEDYLSNKNADKLATNFVNESGQRYASNKAYEENLGKMTNKVKSYSAEKNVAMPNATNLAANTNSTAAKPTTTTTTTTTPKPATTPAATSSTLSGSVGVKGDNKPADVKTVKTLLNKKIGAGLDTANPNVLEKTIAAIKSFQSKNKLTVDGIIGKNGETWKALNGGTTATPAPTPAPAATTSKLSGSVGSKGDNKPADVKTVKTLLNKKIGAGLDTANPNVLEKTIAAIKAFQKKSGLTQTGLINVESSTWRALSGTAAATPTPAPTPAPATGKALSANVGPNQPNVAADVKTVKDLLNKKNNAGLDTANPNVLEKTIAAIKAFQKKSKLSETGIVEKDGATLKALYAAANAPAPAPSTNTSTGQGNLDNVKLHGKVYGAETETEKKLLEFTKALNGIKVEVSKGNIVYVRPPYHINAFGYEKKAAKRTKAINDAATATKVSKIGKATPVELSAFLELCIQRNIIPVKDRTATGLRNFLDTYGFSTDCSGLANQGINFLLDGNLEFNSKTDAVNLNNVGTSSMMGGDFKKVAKPSALKAGDVMVKSGHVRLIIDVDNDGKGGIEFTTTESTAGTGPEGGTGVRQVRWKFPNGAAFSDLKIMSYKTEQFVNADAADRGYIYTRHKKLDNVPA